MAAASLAFSDDPRFVYPLTRRSSQVRLTADDKRLLQELYERSPLTADDLPYSREMDHIHQQFVDRSGRAVEIRDLYRALMILRKQGLLVRKRRPEGAVAPVAAGDPA